MTRGLGLDIVGVARIERALGNPRFLQRVYTPAERERIRLRGAQTAAGLFAAKEAVAKALGTGFRGFCAWDVGVTYDSQGAPRAELFRGALERHAALGGGRIYLSITHADGMAAAVALLTDEREEALS